MVWLGAVVLLNALSDAGRAELLVIPPLVVFGPKAQMVIPSTADRSKTPVVTAPGFGGITSPVITLLGAVGDEGEGPILVVR